jgi:hypothetical protein
VTSLCSVETITSYVSQVPESKNLVMGELIESRSVNAVPIGKIIKSNGSGSRVLLNGRACNSKKTGYKHFE